MYYTPLTPHEFETLFAISSFQSFSFHLFFYVIHIFEFIIT